MEIQDIQEAIDWLAGTYYEWGYAFGKIRAHRPVPGLGTMASDEYWRVYFDPKLDWDQMETRTIVMHETAGHIFGDDTNRMREVAGGRSVVLEAFGLKQLGPGHVIHPAMWNIACDMRINAAIRKACSWAKFPPAGNKSKRAERYKNGGYGGVFPTCPASCDAKHMHFNFPEGMPPEWYYWHLWELAEKNPGPDGQPGDEGEGQPGEGQGQGQPGKGGSGTQVNQGEGEPGEGDGDGDGDGQPGDQPSKGGKDGTINPDQPDEDHGHGNCGSICTGEKAPWEDEPDDECLDEAEREKVIEETERLTAEVLRGDHQGNGQKAGNEARPPMLMDEAKITAKVNHQVLMDAIQKILYEHLERSNRSYMTPHRRIPGLPGTRRVPKQAALIGDISGSINSLAVKVEFEVFEKLYGRGFDIRIIACDTRAHVVTDKKAVYSGGGTDMGAGLELAAQKFPEAGVVIVITDGQTPWPQSNPCQCPVYVLSWEQKGPQWATSVAIPGLTEQELERPKW